MKIITDPKVTMIARQVFFGHPDYKIPADGNDAVKIGAFAAKGCYSSWGENGRSNEENQRAILQHGHGSVLESINFTFFVEGVTRALSLESNRHRNFAVSQRSTRYTAEEGAAIVLEPFYAKIYNEHRLSIGKLDGFWFTDMHDSPDIKKIQLLVDYLNASNQALIAYNKQVEALMEMNPNNLTGFDLRKWARGKARNLLPHGLETQITYTTNVRGLRWFIESRSERHAEPEIRRLADVWLQEVRKIAPLYFEDFEISQFYDGIPEWVAKYKKV